MLKHLVAKIKCQGPLTGVSDNSLNQVFVPPPETSDLVALGSFQTYGTYNNAHQFLQE